VQGGRSMALDLSTSAHFAGLSETTDFEDATRETAAVDNFIHSRRDVGGFETWRVYVGGTKLAAAVRFGVNLTGHTGIVHGGATAAVFDELFAWSSRLCVPAEHAGDYFTANVSIDYRGMLTVNTDVVVIIEQEPVERRKLRMKARMVRLDDNTLLAEASSLFIAPKPQPQPQPPPSAPTNEQSAAPSSPAADSPALLMLPAPEDVSTLITLDVNSGQAVVLDAMGPVVVNSDGTLSRITNWDQMSASEKEVVKRRIAKRNVERLRDFHAKGELKDSLVAALDPKGSNSTGSAPTDSTGRGSAPPAGETGVRGASGQ